MNVERSHTRRGFPRMLQRNDRVAVGPYAEATQAASKRRADGTRPAVASISSNAHRRMALGRMGNVTLPEDALPTEKSTSNTQTTDATEEASKPSPESATGNSTHPELTEEEQKQVREMAARDREVRAHEQAHLAVAGQYARGGAKYEYDTGPDGKQYVVAGHVSVDVGPESTPEETLKKALQVRRAALAPASPSGADRAVAAQASAMAQQAQAEIRKKAASVEHGEPQERAANISNQSG